MTSKEHASLKILESSETRKDEVLVDGYEREKWSMPKRACVPRSDYENKFEIINNSKHRNKCKAFIEVEEIEEESIDTLLMRMKIFES